MQRAATGAHRIDPSRDGRVFDEWRGHVGFEPGVDHERTATAEVLAVSDRMKAEDVGGGIGASERDPEEVVNGAGRERGVIHKDDQREAVDLAATIYHPLLVDPRTELRDRLDRPLTLSEGQIIDAILS